jgi:hypothetical protein
MRRALVRRIGKLEEASKPIARIPCVLRVKRDETTAEALARFRTEFPGARRGHSLLVVPERVGTPEDEAAFAVAFKEQQERSLAAARSPRPQESD